MRRHFSLLLTCSALFLLIFTVSGVFAQSTSDAQEELVTQPGASTDDADELAKKALQKAQKEAAKEEAALRAEDEQPDEALYEEYDLGKTVLRALGTSPTLAQYKASLLGYEASRKSALADMFATINLSYGYTKYDHVRPRDAPRTSQADDDQYSLTVNVDQPIFSGFSLLNTFRRSRLYKRQAEFDLSDQELQMILSIQENFLTLLQARESVRSSEDSVTRLTSQLKVTQAFYDVGLKPRLDVLQAEVDLAQAEDQLLQNRNTVDTQQARLNTLLSLPLDAKVKYVGELTYLPFSMEMDSCLDHALTNRPDIKSAKKDVEIAEKTAQIALADYFPSVTGDFNLYRAGSGPLVNGDNYGTGRPGFSTWTVGASASWKVFDFGSTWYSYRSAQQSMRQKMAVAETLRQEVTYEIKSRYLKINETDKRIKVARKALESAKEGYRMAVARYQAQVGTNTDVLDAQESLTSAETNLSSALADYQTALANMYVSMGMRNIHLLTH